MQYSDMLAQRSGVDLPSTVAAKPTASEAKPKPAASAVAGNAPQRKRKLSFHEKRALETLPGVIDALQAEIEELQATLSDPDLYTRDSETFETATARLADAQAELAAAEERWLELELLREELEGAGGN